MHGGAGDDQVAHTGKPGKGFLFCSQRHAQTGGFRQATGHEHGLGVVPEAETVGDTGAQGNDVFQRRAQLRAHRVGAGVHPKGVRHESVLHEFRKRLIGAGSQQTGGKIDADLLGVAGAGEGDDVLAGLLRDHLTHAQMGALLQALGDGDHHGIFVNVGSHTPADGAQGEGGRCHDHQLAAPDAIVIAADF